MRIECIGVGELEAFAERTLGRQKPDEAVPISRHRARAWARSPCAAPDDPALLVAFDGDRCVGYLGLLPGRVETGSGRRSVLWVSTLFVLPGQPGRLLGRRLIRAAQRHARDLASDSPSRDGSRLVLALGWEELGGLDFWVCDLNAGDLPSAPARALRRLARGRGRGDTPTLDRLVQAARRPGKRPRYGRLAAATAAAWAGHEARPVERVRDRPGAGPGFTGRARFVRDAAVINWMLEHRWVTTDRRQETTGYEFRDWRPLFQYLPFEIYRKASGQYLGFVVLRIDQRHGNRRLAVLDHDLEEHRPLLPLAIDQGRRWMADHLVLPHEAVGEPAALGRESGLFERRRRIFYYFRSGEDSPTEIDLRFADGDYAFT